MTCNDCIHYEKCEACYVPEIGDSFTKLMSADRCNYFLEKQKYIELPCKIGDTVYYIAGIHNKRINSAKVRDVIFHTSENTNTELFVEDENGNEFIHYIDRFYLTKEEAEAELKEREQKK